MQHSFDHEGVVLSFYCKTPSSNIQDDCPAFHRTDRGSWAVQGERREENEVRVQLRAPKETEGCVEIPDDLADLFVRMYAKEKYGVDLGAAPERADSRRPDEPEARAS
ncbi:hypothetical protein F8566_30445 [Actinomadura rudentiformis]|uniref:Uncharacterized protein n=1 Tax=Actinomadura rudentiformis TaxID=359158 RepID=A0A6H9YXK5_9ACTN|nr:hypothetical protein F8566_30445 [Actinomadura rudentiformis]